MGYLSQEERDVRLAKVQEILKANNLDLALVYYDEFNIGNGWYLTGWCPQFESGAVLVLKDGSAMLLGGPESEPFAKQDSAITETRNFPPWGDWLTSVAPTGNPVATGRAWPFG